MTSDSPAGALVALARRHFDRAMFDDARAVAEAALALDPAAIEAMIVLGEAQFRAGAGAAAVNHLRRALALDPDCVAAHAALAEVFLARQDFEASAVHARRAAALAPGDRDAAQALGRALALAGRVDEAMAVFEAEIAQPHPSLVAEFEIAMLHLHARRYREAWPLFEARHALSHQSPAPGTVPLWDGSPLDGRTLCVMDEGGHGDNVWAARFLRGLDPTAGQVLLHCRPALLGLFENLEGLDGFLPYGFGPEGCDVCIPMLSLPAHHADPEALPPAILALQPLPDGRLERMIAAAGDRLKVGILWSGSAEYAHNHTRATPLETFLPLVEMPDIQLYSLQKGPPRAELRAAGLGQLVIDGEDHDFAETAAFLDALDLVVMTDTGVAHIAGSLGVEVWLMLDTCPYWYWGRSGERSHWYPSMRLFRQSRPGDWEGVMMRICVALRARIDDRQLRAVPRGPVLPSDRES